MNNKTDIFIGVLIALVFGVIGFFTISDYGITIDSPHHLLIGDFYLNAFRTGDFNLSDMYQFGGPHSIGADSGMWGNIQTYGPLADVMGSIGYDLFSGSLDYVTSHHLHLILLTLQQQ